VQKGSKEAIEVLTNYGHMLTIRFQWKDLQMAGSAGELILCRRIDYFEMMGIFLSMLKKWMR
jgi:hypothetical protein